MRRAGLFTALAVGLSAASCERGVGDARDQWLVVLATDAPVPQLGDRILVELLDGDGNVACDSCRRELGVTPESDAVDAPPPTFPLSFGVVPLAGIELLRVRLYRTDNVGDDGAPRSDHIVAVGRFPEPSGVTEIALPLLMGCFGIEGDPSGRTTCDTSLQQGLVATPVMAARSAVDLPETGSWAPGASRPCGGPVPDEMVCIEGAALILGGPDPLEGVQGTSSLPERVLGVAPFAIDRDELTVAALRATGVVTAVDPVRPPGDPESPLALCTYTDTIDPARDGLPVDCLTHALAEAACTALGKRLPSEEEWELAAGSRTLELDYPWGDDDVLLCNRAILARGRTVLETPGSVEEFACRGENDPGPVAGGSPGDVSAEGVRNLAGNVDEWVADAFAAYTDPCWTVAVGAVRAAPCTAATPGSATSWAVRGGSYVDAAIAARVTHRKASAGGEATPGRGVRCAKSL